MESGDAAVVVGFAFWAAWSLAWISARANRIAIALERLVDLAERGRR